MKRFISVLLCCVMLMSVFSTAFTVSAANASDYLKVSTAGMKDGIITYTISLLPGQNKLIGSIVHAVYDSSALRVVSEATGAADGANPNVSGVYETGAVYNDANKYSLAYMSTSGVNITAEKDFFTITFEVIAEDGSMADVEFRCLEHRTDDGNSENDVQRTDDGVSFYSDSFLTLDTPAVTKVYSTDKNLVVEWGTVSGAEFYNVYRKVSGASVFEKIAENVVGTSYTDNTIVIGTEYEYTVSAGNENGETAYNTNGVVGFNFGTIETLSATPSVDGITVTWGALQKAEYYEVYRKEATEPENVWVKVASVLNTSTSYKDTAIISGVNYNYKVEAIRGIYRAGTSAQIPTVKFLKTAVPAVNKVYSTAGALVAEWGAVENGASYNVYRKTASSAWEKIASNVKTTNYVDSTVALGTEYFYSVSAVNELKCETAYNKTGVAGLNFGTITTLSAVAAPYGATVTWGALQYAESYEVYRKRATESDSAWVKVATTTKTTYTDETIESFIEYNYKVEAIKGIHRAGTSAAIPTVKFLSAPKFAVANTENGIELYFNNVNGATKYVIEKKTGTGSFVKLAEVSPSDGVYVDKAIVVNGTYTYRIQAFSSDVNLNSKTVTNNAITRLATPEKMVSIAVDVAGMTITWTPVAGATKYNVYRKEIDGKAYAVIGTATGTTYTDKTAKSNVVYTYTVSAANDTGCGAYITKGITRLFLATPKLLSRENVVNGVKITWSAIEGATGYRVYRRGAGAKTWTYLGTFSSSKTYYVDYGKDSTGKNIGMKNGEYYRYTVRATTENRGSNVTYPGGYNQTVLSGFDPTGLYLKYVATPKLISVTNASTGLQIKWNAVSGATKYRVYRRGAGAKSWYYLGEVKGTTYTDTGISSSSGKYYRYTIRAVSGYYSGFDTNGLYLMRLSDPVLISARSSTAGITVKWRAVAGATYYNVYRKTPGKTWQRVAALSGGKTAQYVDKTAKKGVTYTYTVRACCGKTISSYNAKGLTCKDLY